MTAIQYVNTMDETTIIILFTAFAGVTAGFIAGVLFNNENNKDAYDLLITMIKANEVGDVSKIIESIEMARAVLYQAGYKRKRKK